MTTSTAGSTTSPARPRRRLPIVLIVVSLLVGLVAVVAQQLLLPRQDPLTVDPRPLSHEEAERLAGMRERNWHDGGAEVRATITDGTGSVHLAGWVDWQRQVVYLARSGRTPAVVDELLQAVPGLVAYRPGPVATGGDGAATTTPGHTEMVDPHPRPPLEPPADGWQLRRLLPGTGESTPTDPSAVDSALALLLNLSAAEPDSTQLLARSESQWLRQDRTAGYEVDVLLGPAIPPTDPDPADGPTAPSAAADDATADSEATSAPSGGPSLAAMGGAVQYWLDTDGRLHRLSALLSSNTTLEINLDRSAHQVPPVLDLLGGDPINPEPVSWPEAELLAQLGQRNYALGGGAVTVTVPQPDGGAFTARGWLDWQRGIAYLVTGPPETPVGVVWADREAIGYRSGAVPNGQQPPLPAPTDGWQWHLWTDRGDAQGGFDVDLLLNEALNAGSGHGLDPAVIHQHAYRLRADTVGGRQVHVYEIQRQAESQVSPGQSRLRYWVDAETGNLLRLEIRTRGGGFGQLDLTPEPVPYLH